MFSKMCLVQKTTPHFLGLISFDVVIGMHYVSFGGNSLVPRPLVSFPDPQYAHIEGLGTRLGETLQKSPKHSPPGHQSPDTAMLFAPFMYM